MSDEIIDVEAVAEKIVRCPKCGQRNRLYLLNPGANYRCAKCQTSLGNPFSKPPRYKKTVLLVLAALGVTAALVLTGWLLFVGERKSADNTPTPAATVRQTPSRHSSGELTINDALACDTFVKLIGVSNGDRVAPITFFVQKERSTTFRSIPETKFRVMFATGGAWDSLLETFTQDDLYFEFDGVLDFSKSNTVRALTFGKVGPDQAHFSPITKVDFSQ